MLRGKCREIVVDPDLEGQNKRVDPRIHQLVILTGTFSMRAFYGSYRIASSISLPVCHIAGMTATLDRVCAPWQVRHDPSTFTIIGNYAEFGYGRRESRCKSGSAERCAGQGARAEP